MREPSGEREASLLPGGNRLSANRTASVCRSGTPRRTAEPQQLLPRTTDRATRSSLIESRCAFPLAVELATACGCGCREFSCSSRRCSLRGNRRSTSRARNPQSVRVESPHGGLLARSAGAGRARLDTRRVTTAGASRREISCERGDPGKAVHEHELCCFPRDLQVVERCHPSCRRAKVMRRTRCGVAPQLQGGDEHGTRSPLGLGIVCVRSERNLAQKRE
jgi:hypothetical protein